MAVYPMVRAMVNTYLLTYTYITIMANINKLEMGRTLATDPRISTTSTFFGLIHTSVYVPTGSKLATYTFEYPVEREAKIENLLGLTGDALAKAAADIHTLKSDALGNLRLEACVSADRKFAALQLFRYSNFEATPLSRLALYEDADAATIASLL